MALINTFSTSSSLRSLYLSFTTFTHSTVLVTPTEFLMVSYLDHPEGPSCSRSSANRSSIVNSPVYLYNHLIVVTSTLSKHYPVPTVTWQLHRTSSITSRLRPYQRPALSRTT